ncbi:hypothetical protein [uncultured Acetobacteroides sp.]|uniref:hypothetical protein n=1 Tax=uncultured Acetobacteroides sp. TaxID=1760811 RepID=UPI0029F5513D|nr:hypothetical protein [uncultured Acetobacteroides sp.]
MKKLSIADVMASEILSKKEKKNVIGGGGKVVGPSVPTDGECHVYNGSGQLCPTLTCSYCRGGEAYGRCAENIMEKVYCTN